MARFYGKIGYATTTEVSPGVYKPQITEHEYFGDVLQDIRQYEMSGKVNENVNISNRFSVVADVYAYDNYALMRYVEFMGVKWTVTKVEIMYPRIIISVGGLYNGE